jgi:hypothetical protein
MAKGADLVVGGGCPPHMVYVRVAPDVKASSRSWSQAWCKTYTQAVSRLRWEVAECVLNGLPMTRQVVVIGLPGGACLEVRVTCSRTQIVIHVLDFVGPLDPGPDGGIWQPRAAEGSAHGAYRAGSVLRLVPFYEPMPWERLVDILSQPFVTRAGMQSDSAPHSSRHPTARATMVSMPKTLTLAFAIRDRESRNAQHDAIARKSPKSASGKLEAQPTTLLSKRPAAAAPDADLPSGPRPTSNARAGLIPAQGISGIFRSCASKPIIGLKSRLQPYPDPDFDRSVFLLAAIRSRHMPQQLQAGQVMPPPRGEAIELRLH